MFDIDKVNKQIKDLMSSCNIVEEIEKRLLDLGWTNEEINKVKEEINMVEDSVIQESSNISSLQEPLKSSSEQAYSQTKNIVYIQETNLQMNIKNAYERDYQRKNKNNPIPGNNKVEDIVYKEPIVQGVFTSPVDIDDSHYSLKEDYPYSYGFRDSAGNYFKINTLKNQIDFVHSSGTLIKIDKDGNVTMHIVGNKKEIIEGDYTLDVKGNMDLFVRENFQEIVGLIKNTLVGIDNNLIVGNTDRTISNKIEHN